ncbi:MAG: hypothetical protein J6M62_10655 [Selenomonadaceae bacterium]|nr:hypothetical protein [Selenomonadaceae bacterium]
MAKIDANLMRDYEAYKDCSKEELDEYLKTLPPSKREAYLEYAAKMKAKQAAKAAEKKKESQGQIGCLIAVLIFAGVIGITAYFQDKGEEEAPPAPPKVEQKASESKSAAAVVAGDENGDADKKDDAKTKELKKMEFAKWNEATERRISAIDDGWKNLWNNVLAAFSKGDADKSKARQDIENFNKKLEEYKAQFKEQKFSEHLSKEERDKLKEANEDFVVWIDERKDACDDLEKLAEKGEISPEKLKAIEEALKKSDTKMRTKKAAIEEFQRGMGLL